MIEFLCPEPNQEDVEKLRRALNEMASQPVSILPKNELTMDEYHAFPFMAAHWKHALNKVHQFQSETFPEATLTAWLKHLREECGELLEDERSREECADVIMLAFGVLRHLCADPENIKAVFVKLEKNRAREWASDEDGNYRHVKELK